MHVERINAPRGELDGPFGAPFKNKATKNSLGTVCCGLHKLRIGVGHGEISRFLYLTRIEDLSSVK